MNNEFTSSWWSIELPLGWSAEREESCTNIWSEDGVGALQISAYQRDGEPVSDEDLYDFAEREYPEGVRVLNENCGQFSGLNVSFLVENSYWRKWWLRNGSLFLFVTYNCNVEEQGLERSAVDQMLATLKPKAPAS